jgi:hypothetical protein
VFDVSGALWATVSPARLADGLDLGAAVAFGALVGLAVAATLAARGKSRGAGQT